MYEQRSLLTFQLSKPKVRAPYYHTPAWRPQFEHQSELAIEDVVERHANRQMQGGGESRLRMAGIAFELTNIR